MATRRGTIKVKCHDGNFVEIAFSPDPEHGVKIQSVSGKDGSPVAPLHFVSGEQFEEFMSEVRLAWDLHLNRGPRGKAA